MQRKYKGQDELDLATIIEKKNPSIFNGSNPQGFVLFSYSCYISNVGDSGSQFYGVLI